MCLLILFFYVLVQSLGVHFKTLNILIYHTKLNQKIAEFQFQQLQWLAKQVKDQADIYVEMKKVMHFEEIKEKDLQMFNIILDITYNLQITNFLSIESAEHNYVHFLFYRIKEEFNKFNSHQLLPSFSLEGNVLQQFLDKLKIENILLIHQNLKEFSAPLKEIQLKKIAQSIVIYNKLPDNLIQILKTASAPYFILSANESLTLEILKLAQNARLTEKGFA